MHEGSMNICNQDNTGYELEARGGNFNSLLRVIAHPARVSGERHRKERTVCLVNDDNLEGRSARVLLCWRLGRDNERTAAL
jgi:hypothetical protein